MIVCLDTNVLLQAAKRGHPFASIIQAWFARRFLWAVSTEILLEYEEVVMLHSGSARWRELAAMFEMAERRGDFLLHAHPAFRFHIIPADPDDNKFTD